MISSWRTMKKLAYGGATLWTIARPTSWRKNLSINEKFLFFKMVSSNILGVWATWSRESGCDFMLCTADSMRSSYGIFVYSYVISAVTKTEFSGRGGRDSRSCKKCFMFWMYEGSVSTRNCIKWVSLEMVDEVITYWYCWLEGDVKLVNFGEAKVSNNLFPPI